MTIRSRQRRPLTTLLSTCYTFRNCFENCVNLSLSFIKWIRTYFSISIVTLEFFLYFDTFLLLSMDRYLCLWTISSRGYHPPSSQCFGTDMVYQVYCFQQNVLLLDHIVITKISPLRVPQPIVASLFWFSCSTSMEKKSFDLFSNTQYDVTLETTDFFVVFF